MCCAGIGKTTLANEICLRWAKDDFLSEDFGAVVLVPMKNQQRSLSFEEVMVEYTEEKLYRQLMKLEGRRCLIVLEGLDEIPIDYHKSDPFLKQLIYDHTVLKEAVIVVTSRPHGCVNLHADKIIEILGFNSKENVSEFVLQSFSDDIVSAKELLQQLNEYPQLLDLCLIPIVLVIISNIFLASENTLPLELYSKLIVRILKQTEGNSKSNITITNDVSDVDVEALCKQLKGIPKETVSTVLMLSLLAYWSFVDWCTHKERKAKSGRLVSVKEPKILFTASDLLHCGIHATAEFDGFGLLKITHVHQTHSTYQFLHISIQEFLCLLHVSLLPQQNQMDCLEKLFDCSNNFKMWLDLTSPLDQTVFINGMFIKFLQ